MSVVDRWLGPATQTRRNAGSATTATSATAPRDTSVSARNYVAGGLRQAATSESPGANVARRSNGVATRKMAVLCGSRPQVADVANVAEARFQDGGTRAGHAGAASTGGLAEGSES